MYEEGEEFCFEGPDLVAHQAVDSVWRGQNTIEEKSVRRFRGQSRRGTFPMRLQKRIWREERESR